MATRRIIAKGAEAILYMSDEKLVKERVKKEYRLPELDNKLRGARTKHETKILTSAKDIIHVPKIFKVSEKDNTIEMEFIQGKTLKEFFESCGKNEIDKISENIGASIGKLHSKNIIHNDLTTSNMLLKEEAVYFIDFGLGTHSTRTEDKAMDLVVLKKALMATHPKIFRDIWDSILKGYKNETRIYGEIIKRIETIEKRARYTE